MRSTGIGFASIIISALVSISYNVVIAYAMYFLLVSLVSMDSNVPWATCGNEWNTDYCRTETQKITSSMNESEKINITLGQYTSSSMFLHISLYIAFHSFLHSQLSVVFVHFFIRGMDNLFFTAV
jgi:hypothetical protein